MMFITTHEDELLIFSYYVWKKLTNRVFLNDHKFVAATIRKKGKASEDAVVEEMAEDGVVEREVVVEDVVVLEGAVDVEDTVVVEDVVVVEGARGSIELQLFSVQLEIHLYILLPETPCPSVCWSVTLSWHTNLMCECAR